MDWGIERSIAVLVQYHYPGMQVSLCCRARKITYNIHGHIKRKIINDILHFFLFLTVAEVYCIC